MTTKPIARHSDCTICGGRIAYYNGTAGPGWYHSDSRDWQDKPHHGQPSRVFLRCPRCEVVHMDEDQDVCFHCSESGLS